MKRHVLWVAILATLISCRNQPEIKSTDNSTPAWYKQQVIYNLDVKVFKDSNGDGLGDFKGLTQKLGYLDSLGITTIWLAPFQPSPWADDGYDVTSYNEVDPRLGTQADFHQFIQAARQRHMRVMIDIALNHSSIKHPWFRQRPDWYVWSVKRPADWNKGMGFPEVEKQSWMKDSVTGNYYFHRFYHFQPDLNFQNPAVLAEAKRILAFWLEQGVDGFRLDAVPFIIDDPLPSAEDPRHHFKILHELALSARKIKSDVALLGEANVKPEETKDYFSRKGEGLDMMLNFEVNEYLFYALATGDAQPLKEALQATAEKPRHDQWIYFLRNHDEIDLGKLSGSQIKKVFAAMGPDTNMQLYKRGIRRRLASMLDNDFKRIKQSYSILFALPGTPVVRYGDEIGMGDDLKLKERFSVRTPMQWDASLNSGFSMASRPIRPIISQGDYSYQKINVQKQARDSSSLLRFVSDMIRLRKNHPEIAQGVWDMPDVGNKHCLALRHRDKLITVFNFSNGPQKVHLPLSSNSLKDLITGQKLPVTNSNELSLPAYAGYWLYTGN
jgi:maltose alpha-D-glucosyltransferase/alpha-amylase